MTITRARELQAMMMTAAREAFNDDVRMEFVPAPDTIAALRVTFPDGHGMTIYSSLAVIATHARRADYIRAIATKRGYAEHLKPESDNHA